jgi:two-component system, cell cycle sensor histidine kinase and response regulator CckA
MGRPSMTTQHRTDDATGGVELASSEATVMLDAAEELAPMGTFLWRVGSEQYQWSPGLGRVLGFGAGHVPRPERLLERVHPEDRRRVSRLLRFALRGNDVDQSEFRWLHVHGEIQFLVARVRAVVVDGELKELRGAVLDISERRRIEEQMLQTQKLEAVGTLAGGVAHDFNNFLQVIGGHCDLLLLDTGASPRARMSLEEIGVAVARCKDLTQKLLAFARKQHTVPTLNDVSALVTSTVRMLRPLLGDDVALEVKPSAMPCIVRIDPVHLQQVLVNLAVNARDAMPKGGVLGISVEQRVVDDAQATRLRVSPGSYCQMVVTDSGIGMPESVAVRVFEPFFTTKPRGLGTGLGLSTVHGIVHDAGGSIGLESTVGKGSSFTVLLPTSSSEPAFPAAGATPRPTRSGTETILLVEDGDEVRRVTELQLTSAGYRVIGAPNGEAALQLATEFEGPIHLLLSDVMMPRMSGPELAHRLMDQRPGLPVVFMSGYTERQVLRRTALTHDRVSLHKPFSLDELLHCVREHLD